MGELVVRIVLIYNLPAALVNLWAKEAGIGYPRRLCARDDIIRVAHLGLIPK